MLKPYISVFFISILLCCGTSPQAPVADVDADENVDVDVGTHYCVLDVNLQYLVQISLSI